MTQHLRSSAAGTLALLLGVTILLPEQTSAQSAVTLNPHATWASYFGGGSSETLYDAAMMGDGALVIAGESTSATIPSIPASTSKPVRAKNGGTDGVVARFNTNGSLLWYTY